MELTTIYAPIQEDLEKVEERLKALSNVKFPHLSELLEYGLKSNGKRIRPVLTLLSGKLYEHNPEHLLSMATAVEVLHTATLIHDDAIDKSSMRRGRPTINQVWNDEKAVLLGDYLFAEAGALTASTDNLRAIKLFADTLKTISAGELNQSYYSFSLNQGRPEYLQRIAQKTASLFSMATESGAALSRAPEESIQVLIEYSYNFGVAFQIVDDILDFIGTEEELGKPAGSDLGQGTLTLPSLMLLERYPDDNPVKRLFENPERQEEIPLAIDMVRNSSIIQECYKMAGEYCEKAGNGLALLPDTPARSSIRELLQFIADRKK